MKAVKHHVSEKWVVMYIERWIKAPIILPDGTEQKRTSGTPQGGVISPILANLTLHYVLDAWMRRELPCFEWCRYSDDGVVHCRSKAEATYVQNRVKARLEECGLEMHPEKSRIVFCWDGYKSRPKMFATSFTFLGYEFRARSAMNSKTGKVFTTFLPAVGKSQLKEMRRKVKYELNLRGKIHWDITEIAKLINPIARGWFNYYGKFQPSALNPIWRYINDCLMGWAKRKYKSLLKMRGRAFNLLERICQAKPRLFAHWQYCRHC
jgi:group II intron reverse transcriptase/maturase